jgi:hypothetical protein
MVTRCWDGSYEPNNNSGPFLADLPAALQPAFGETAITTSPVLPDAQGVVLLCSLATAFVAHYNAPRFHSELEDNTVTRFDTVVAISFGIAAALFAIVAVTGFATFGSHAQPLILNNYSPHDPLATTSRAAIAASILVTFPVPFLGLRDGVLDALRVVDDNRIVLALYSTFQHCGSLSVCLSWRQMWLRSCKPFGTAVSMPYA